MCAKNVPILDLRYWIAILLASIMGTAFGDYISSDLKFGFAGGLLTLSVVIAVIFIAERTVRWNSVVWYWAAIEATRMAATNFGDFLSTTMRFGNGRVAAMLAVLLIVFLFVTKRKLPGDTGRNAESGRKSLPQTDTRYWVAILIASTLGTTLGDFISGNLGFGLRLGSLSLGALLAIVVTFELSARTASEPRYWLAVVCARTAGTVMGDYLTSERGLNLGCALGASLAFVLLVVVILFPRLAFGKRDILESAEADTE